MSSDTAKPKRPAGNPKPGSPEQYARFVETARKLECDDDAERFEAQLGKIAKAKPPKDGNPPSE